MRLTTANNEDRNSSLQFRRVRHDAGSSSLKESTPPEEYIYTETVKSIGNNEFIEEKRLLKRASWTPPAGSPDNGLPPSGKRSECEQLNTTRHSNRVRLRPKTARYYQPAQIPTLVRPVSYTERYNRHLIDYQQHKPTQPTLNRHRSFSHQRHDLSPSPSSSSMDTLVQITSRASPSLDNSDFISDTSTASSVTTANTLTSVCSSIPSVRFSHRPNSTSDSICSSPTRSFLSEYPPRAHATQIDYRVLTPVSNIDLASTASPITSSPSSTSSLSTSTAAVACPKGHDQLSSSSSSSSFPSPMRSSLNQYAKFTSQTPTADTSRDDISPATTTRSLMTMSMSPNRHHNQTRSVKAIIASAQISPSTDVTSTTNNGDGLKQQDQTESTTVANNGCLKSPSNAKSNSRVKKSVHFDWHVPPEEIRSSSSSLVKASRSNYRPTTTVTIASSSSLFNENGNGDNDEQKKLDDEWRAVGGTGRENERIETATRTITTNPLTNNHHHRSTILRSLSLSSSPPPTLSNEESNDSRRYREEKKENVYDSNCTTSRRVTTAAVAAAAAHLHRTATTPTVTFNDGSNNNVSQKNESNSTNNSNTILLKRPSSSDNHMPLNSLLVKAPSLSTIVNPPNPPTSSTAKKLISHGFFSLIGRSNSNNNKSPSTTTTTTSEENKQLRRTSSTQLRAQQRKAKQQTTSATGPNGNQRLSADVESLLPVSSTHANHAEISLEEKLVSDKVTTHRESERQSSMSLVSNATDKKTTSTTSASNMDLSFSPCQSTTLNDSTMPVPSTSTMTTVIKADGGDSLDNGFLFQPVPDPKCDYVLHQHQTSNEKEPFFLSPSNAADSAMTQTSTLIISTPPQYHYYLYPPINNTNTLSSSSSSASSISSSSKKAPKIIATSNRTISNVSINSVSTNSSSSYPSYESHTHDHDYQHSSSQLPLHAEDETLSSSTNSIVVNYKIRQKKVVQSALIDWKMKTSAESTSDPSIRTKPVILSDSVQAFWPPPPSPSTLDKDPGQKATVLTTEQTKQSESIAISNPLSSSTSNQNSINLPPPPPLEVLSSNDETGSYSEQHTFSPRCLRNASETSLEDTQASYIERLRQKSRSIPMNGNVHSHEMFTHLRRAVSKDTLNDSHRRSNTHLHTTDFPATSEKTLRPKSAGHQLDSPAIQGNVPEPTGEHLVNDFRSKRDFFENRTYAERAISKSPSVSPPTSSATVKPKVYTLYPMNSPTMNNKNSNHGLLQATTVNHNNHHQPHYVTRRSWNDLLSQSSPSPSPSSPSAATDSSGNSAVLAPPPANPMHRKPVRIVKAVQRSPPSNGEVLSSHTRPLTSSKTYSLAKPGLFSASPINNSLQKLPTKSTNATRRFQSRDETDLQCSLKEFAARYPSNHSFNELARLTLSDDHHLSTDYTRSLFPIPDRLRRLRSRQSSGGETNSMTTSNSSSFDYISRTVSAEQTIFDDHSLRQADDLICNLKKHLEMLKDNQRMINEEITDNQTLGSKLLSHIECHAEPNEIEKFKLHINEIDTITSILLKLSSRLAKIENDLSTTLPEHSESSKASLIERREQAQEKHDEAKALKDGIDRRSRLVTTLLRKYFSQEQFDDYEHFIRMKSTLLMDAKDLEEHLSVVQKQLQLLQTIFSWLATPVHNDHRYSSSIADFQSLNSSNHADNLQTNAYKTISSTA